MNNQQWALIKLEENLNELCSTSMGRRTFLASAGLLLAGCQTAEKHRSREGDNSGQSTAMTVADEQRMTNEVQPQMRKDYPPLQNSDVQSYISNLGRKIATSNGLEGNPYKYSFTAVDVDYVNAFALPAGTVMVTTPLIAMAETEAELAGVIGHEIGHIKARHTAERMEKAKKSQSKSWMYAAGGGVLGGLVGLGVGSLICKKNDKKCLADAAQYGVMAGVGGGLLVQKYAFMANSREDEMEADRIGFRTSVASQFHKDHVGTFYAKLLQMEKQNKGKQDPITRSLSDAMSTHPPSQERVQQMNQLASEQALSKSMVVSTREFERIREIARRIVQSKPKKATS
ncbi:MAG: M48 family metalloprotease [Bdellovibrionales bacterium]